MLEIQMVLTWLTACVQSTRERPRDDRGAGIVETTVIIGLFVAAAIVIVGILVNKATTAANNVRTQ
jgi:Flp pilus assembly pilin Flp